MMANRGGKGSLAGMNIRGTFKNYIGGVRSSEPGAIPHICVDTEAKMRRIMSAYIDEEFFIRKGSERKVVGKHEHHVAVLRAVYSHCALFETVPAKSNESSTVFGTMIYEGSPVRFSRPLSVIPKYYRPVKIRKGYPWPKYDGELIEDGEEED